MPGLVLCCGASLKQRWVVLVGEKDHMDPINIFVHGRPDQDPFHGS